jgi:hypothetical protein
VRQEPSSVERIEYPFSARSDGCVAAVLRLSFPVHPALLVSFAITISIRTRVHNEYFLQKVIDGVRRARPRSPGWRVEHGVNAE